MAAAYISIVHSGSKRKHKEKDSKCGKMSLLGNLGEERVCIVEFQRFGGFKFFKK